MAKSETANILVVDDEPAVLRVLELILLSKNYNVVAVSSGEQARDLLAKQKFDLLVSDIVMEPINGVELFHIAQASQPDIPAIMISGFATMDISIDAIREGVFDCLTKPFPPDRFLSAVENALNFAETRGAGIDLKSQPDSDSYFGGVIAENPKMKHVCDFVERVAAMDVPILIIGESGVGKELIAKTIHAHSDKKDRTFLAVNCAGLPVSFFDSIFRSDTEASADTADVGTVLLKEIGVMPIAIQDRLVKILEHRAATKGTAKYQNIRILASTQRPLDTSIQDGSFRQSLHRYFSVISIAIPPLKERREDILPLVTHFLRIRVKEESKLPTLTLDAHDALEKYPWPGNVRELRDSMESALASAGESGQIDMENLPQTIVDFLRAQGTGTRGRMAEEARGQFLKESFKEARNQPGQRRRPSIGKLDDL
ncbi:MAG: sigma-54-dependent Fis family transcriptional regulator [Kiritimatiellae bacterium]|nr:sigma-54-dependent Fis family transcriptional regulator [Kiritimatiellia bacterium]